MLGRVCVVLAACAALAAAVSQTSDFVLVSPFHVPNLMGQTDDGTDLCAMPTSEVLECLNQRAVPLSATSPTDTAAVTDRIGSGISVAEQALYFPTWWFPEGADSLDGNSDLIMSVATRNDDLRLTDSSIEITAIQFQPNRARTPAEQEAEADQVSNARTASLSRSFGKRAVSVQLGMPAGPKTEADATADEDAAIEIANRDHKDAPPVERDAHEYRLEQLGYLERIAFSISGLIENVYSIYNSASSLGTRNVEVTDEQIAAGRVVYSGNGDGDPAMLQYWVETVDARMLSQLRYVENDLNSEAPADDRTVCKSNVVQNSRGASNSGIPSGYTSVQGYKVKVTADTPKSGDPAYDAGLRFGNHDYNGLVSLTLKVNGQTQCALVYVVHGPFDVLGDVPVALILTGAAIVAGATARTVYKREKAKREKAKRASLDSEAGDAEAEKLDPDTKSIKDAAATDESLLNAHQGPIAATAGAVAVAAAPSRAVMVGRARRSVSSGASAGSADKRASVSSQASSGSKKSTGAASSGSRASERRQSRKSKSKSSKGSRASMSSSGSKGRKSSKSGSKGRHSSKASTGSRASRKSHGSSKA